MKQVQDIFNVQYRREAGFRANLRAFELSYCESYVLLLIINLIMQHTIGSPATVGVIWWFAAWLTAANYFPWSLWFADLRGLFKSHTDPI